MLVGPLRGSGNLIRESGRGQDLRQQRIGIKRDTGNDAVQLLRRKVWRGLLRVSPWLRWIRLVLRWIRRLLLRRIRRLLLRRIRRLLLIRIRRLLLRQIGRLLLRRVWGLLLRRVWGLLLRRVWGLLLRRIG